MNTENNIQPDLRARRIIDACFIGGLSEELDRELLKWLVKGLETGRIDDILLDKWLENITAAEHPDQRAMHAFDLAMEQLGFPEELRARLSDVRGGVQLKENNDAAHTQAPVVPLFNKKRTIPLRRFIVRTAAVMIPAIMAIGAGWFLFGERRTEQFVAELVMSVDHGLQKQVSLSDNSEVWINSGSTLQYDGSSGNRRVARLSGEAYFKVAKGVDKPFLVKTDKTEIRVTGTEFNVKEDTENDVTRIILTEGHIDVGAGGDTHTLDAGEWLEYDHLNGGIARGVSDMEFADWRSPIQTLSNRSLGDIFKIVCDYYDYRLAINTNLSASEYSIKFRGTDPIETLLYSLSISSGEFSFRVEEGKVIIDSQ